MDALYEIIEKMPDISGKTVREQSAIKVDEVIAQILSDRAMVDGFMQFVKEQKQTLVRHA